MIIADEATAERTFEEQNRREATGNSESKEQPDGPVPARPVLEGTRLLGDFLYYCLLPVASRLLPVAYRLVQE